MLVNETHLEQLNAPIQRIKARVELYLGSALTSICNCGETLRDFTIERTGENKFFGFGICQKINGTLIDLYKEIDISKDHTVEGAFGVGPDFVYPFPKFYIQDFKRDEVSGTVTFTGYDVLFKAENFTFEELPLAEGYTVRMVAAACANVLEAPIKFIDVDDTLFDTYYTTVEEGNRPNFSGEESVRRVLDAIAEFTQTIYYIDSNWNLVFRTLNPAEEPALTIDGGQYFSFENGGDRRLKNIVSVTEGEDNVDSVGEGEGVTQFIRDNPFLTLRDDIDSLLAQAQANVGGMVMSEFDMEWSGNYLLEIGDRIAMETEDSTVYSYLLDDSLTFDGGLYQVTSWHFDENEGERASNPITLGEALNQTYIRVDKANKQITMLVSESDATKDRLTVIEQDAGSITQSVEDIQKNVKNINGEIETITEQVSTMVTSEAFKIGISQVVENGVSKVVTEETGYRFDKEGLTISKLGREMSTQITEDGMSIKRDNTEVLRADNTGVKAQDLHATTYLIIGGRSRFENSTEGNRTCCYWIGGMN